MRVLIYGCSRLTVDLMPQLAGDGMDITVLGPERSCLEGVAAHPGVQVILTAEPMMQDYLLAAGISRADVFLAVSSDDHENILAAQIARNMFGITNVVCHLHSPQLQVLYTGLGLNVVGYSFGLLQDVRQAIGK